MTEAPLPHEGPLPDPHAVGESGSLASGPGVRIRLRLARDSTGTERIAEARFETVACDDARPVASALCAALVGATPAEAARVSANAVARLAGRGGPDAATRIVHYAKSASLAPFLGRHAAAGPDVVCTCFGVTATEIRDVIARHGCRTVDELQRHLPASRGCGTCRPDLERLLADAASG